MKKIGIICEYNPFHNGHIYHLQKIKELYPDSIIILVMSGNFTMRGELSLLNKWDKTRLALLYGVNLVIELPLYYATNSADIFAEGAIKILNAMHCDYLIFGSECNDVSLLTHLADIQLHNLTYDEKVRFYMDKGYNYPTSMSKALQDIDGKTINLPNDLLGLSYIKQIMLTNSSITPITIQRTNDYHDKNNQCVIASATSIREAIQNNQDITHNVPKETLEWIIKKDYQKNYFIFLRYQILNNIDSLNTFLDVDEGLDNLIRKNIMKATSLNELILLMKTKRYTYNRLNRMFNHVLLNMRKNNVKEYKKINYLRVLGFDKKGSSYLKSIKGKTSIPIITNYSDIDDKNLTLEQYTTYIYNMIIERNDLNIREIKSIPIQKND